MNKVKDYVNEDECVWIDVDDLLFPIFKMVDNSKFKSEYSKRQANIRNFKLKKAKYLAPKVLTILKNLGYCKTTFIELANYFSNHGYNVRTLSEKDENNNVFYLMIITFG